MVQAKRDHALSAPVRRIEHVRGEMNDPGAFIDQAEESLPPGLGAGEQHRPAVPAAGAGFDLAAAPYQTVQLVGTTPGSGLRQPTAEALAPGAALKTWIGSIIYGISDS